MNARSLGSQGSRVGAARGMEYVGKTDSEYCHMRGRKGSLRHILSDCKSSLAEGLYTYRHNENLNVTFSPGEVGRTSASIAGSG